MGAGIIYTLITVAMMAAGQIFFKKSSLFIEQNQDLPFLMRYLQNYWLYVGVFIFGIATLVWIKALSYGKLSTLYPMQSIAYIIVAVSAYFIFGEKISVYNIVGMFLIITGIFFVSRVN